MKCALLSRQRKRDGGFIALGAQPADHADRKVGKARVMTEFFPRKYVADMNLDEWDAYRRQRISQGDAGMGIGRRIDHNEGNPGGTRSLHLVDQLTFVIALKAFQGCAGAFCHLDQPGIDFGQGRVAIDPRFAAAQQIQVGAVQNQDLALLSRLTGFGLTYHSRQVCRI
jgi:hypothetical protein